MLHFVESVPVELDSSFPECFVGITALCTVLPVSIVTSDGFAVSKEIGY